jgi:EAL domain-containing protein (putative c-di-GMP-specific phosphodiesterase class I)
VKNQIDLRAGLIRLRERGVGTAIDDFGTGQTSLSLISRLPTDYVKLDGSLLQADRPDLSRGLLEIGVQFARLIGAAVIVEMVETKDDLDLAVAVGAEFVQGWYFGKPLDLREPDGKEPQVKGGGLTQAPSPPSTSSYNSSPFHGLNLGLDVG